MDSFDLYQAAMNAITDDCLADDDNLGPYIRVRKERKAENLMRLAMGIYEADAEAIDQVIMVIMGGLRSPSYGR